MKVKDLIELIEADQKILAVKLLRAEMMENESWNLRLALKVVLAISEALM